MSDEAKTPEAPQPPIWEKKTAFEITRRLREVIQASIKATELELEVQRRKLEKATYGG